MPFPPAAKKAGKKKGGKGGKQGKGMPPAFGMKKPSKAMARFGC